MSFAECAAQLFTAVSVRKNTPESSGVYGLSNERGRIFIGEASAHERSRRALEYAARAFSESQEPRPKSTNRIGETNRPPGEKSCSA